MLRKFLTQDCKDPYVVGMVIGAIFGTIVYLIAIGVLAIYTHNSTQTEMTDAVIVQGGSNGVDAVNEMYTANLDENGDVHYSNIKGDLDSDDPDFKADANTPAQTISHNVKIDSQGIGKDDKYAVVTYTVTIKTEGKNASPYCTIKDAHGKIVSEDSATGDDASVTCEYTQRLEQILCQVDPSPQSTNSRCVIHESR